MVNLYQLLGLLPSASSIEIKAALSQRMDLDPSIAKAVEDWLLIDSVRSRYDAKLRQEQPEFFSNMDSVSSVGIDEEYIPELWNPLVAAIIAIIFSPIFGAWLHALNWEELGDTRLAKQNMYVVWGTASFAVAAMVFSGITGRQIPIYAGTLISLAWYFALGKQQVDLVRSEGEYEHKLWRLPLIYSLVGVAVFFLVANIIGLLLIISGLHFVLHGAA